MKQINSTITMTIGEVIPFQSFTPVMTHSERAEKVKSVVYSLTEKHK
jgi:hypothetical protein